MLIFLFFFQDYIFSQKKVSTGVVNEETAIDPAIEETKQFSFEAPLYQKAFKALLMIYGTCIVLGTLYEIVRLIRKRKESKRLKTDLGKLKVDFITRSFRVAKF